MRGATTKTVRERVGPWSACAYLALARSNFLYRCLDRAERNALAWVIVHADDTGRLRVTRREVPCGVQQATCRLVVLGFIEFDDAGPWEWHPRRNNRRVLLLTLPMCVAELEAADDFRARRARVDRWRRPEWQIETLSGRRFYELLGYGKQWSEGRAKVAAAVTRLRGGRRGEPRERLEE